MRGIGFRGYEVPFRGEIRSEDLASNFEQIRSDLAEALRREQYLRDIYYRYVDGWTLQQLAFSNYLSGLRSSLDETKGSYDAGGGKVLHWTAYDIRKIVSNSSNHDVVAGELTLPWARSWTKIPRVVDEYGRYRASTTCNIYKSEDAGEYAHVAHGNLAYNCLDGDPGTYWFTSYPTASAPATVALKISLPSPSNPSISMVYVAPFPDRGATVSNIQYLSRANSWTQIPGFAATSTMRRYHFTPLTYNNQAIVTLTPATLLDSTGAQVKAFGLRCLDVGLVEYVDSSTIVMRLDAPSGVTITSITYVNLDYSVSPAVTETSLSDSDRPVILRVYEDAALSTLLYSNLVYEHPYSGTLAAATSPLTSLWAKIDLKKINSTTPVVRGLTIRFA